MLFMYYIALPTVYRESQEKFRKKTEKGPPYNIYAFGEIKKDGWKGKIAQPPYYKVVGVKKGKPVLKEIKECSNEFRKISKWAGNTAPPSLERRILNFPEAGCIKEVDEKMVVELLSDTDK